MSAVIQMPSAIDASIRACCTEAVQQAVAVLAAKYKFDAEEAERELKLDEMKLEASVDIDAAGFYFRYKPKKAKTGYLLFCDDVRADVKALLREADGAGEKLKGSDVISGCAAKWKELSKEEQADWNEAAKAAVERVE